MAFVGTYEMVSTDKYEDYLKAVGVGMVQRNLAAKAKPVMTYSLNGGKWTQKTSTTFKTFEITFTPGEEFDEETADGRTVKSVITVEGNKLIHKQKFDNLEATTIREFNGSDMTSTFTSGGVTAVRKYKKTG